MRSERSLAELTLSGVNVLRMTGVLKLTLAGYYEVNKFIQNLAVP